MKPETQMKYVAANVTRLAKFLTDNRPSCHRMHLRRSDWRLIHDNPAIARTFGFRVDGEQLNYKEFTLEPTDCGAHHSTQPCRS